MHRNLGVRHFIQDQGPEPVLQLALAAGDILIYLDVFGRLDCVECKAKKLAMARTVQIGTGASRQIFQRSNRRTPDIQKWWLRPDLNRGPLQYEYGKA